MKKLRPRVQTNIELFHQMEASGYTSEDIKHVSNVYRITQSLFPSRFRASGKPFICHLVGTTSDLVQEGAAVEILAAGLLHAAYNEGDFGYIFIGHKADSKRKRQWLKSRVGKTTEHYVHRYTNMPWNMDTIPKIDSQISHFDETQRSVLMIRLANEVDDFRDLGALHCRDPEKRLLLIESYGDKIISMASRLGCRYIESELMSAFQICLTADLGKLPSDHHQYSYVLASKSYRRTPALTIRNLLAKFRRKLNRTIS